MAAKTRVLLVDDHAILREGLRALLQISGDIEVVGEASDGREGIDRAVALRPDIVVMDVSMEGLGGYEATIEIRKLLPDVKVLVLTQYEDRSYVRRFLQAGVSGYLLKKSAGSELVSAIRAVARGGVVLDPEVAREALAGASATPGEGGCSPYDALTDREKQVLRLVAEGQSNKEIAALLEISVKTAMSHREHLMEKLGLHSRTELVKFALKEGVISLDG